MLLFYTENAMKSYIRVMSVLLVNIPDLKYLYTALYIYTVHAVQGTRSTVLIQSLFPTTLLLSERAGGDACL